MAHGGRWIMIATLAGDPTNVDLRKLYVNNSRLIGTTLRSRTSEAKKEILTSVVDTIWPKVENGEIRPTIWKTYPMAQAEEAQDEMQSGRSVGKIVLKVR
jgi:NADPH2:quinone reductase